MKKQRMINTTLWVVAIILLVLVVVSILNFKKVSENKVIDYTNKETVNTKEEEKKLVNETTMSEAELRELVIEKHDALSRLIRNVKYYNASEVAEGFNNADNDKIVLTEDFVNNLNSILSSFAFKYYNDKLNEAVLKANSGISGRIYVASKDIFNGISDNSAISWTGFDKLELKINKATDAAIESTIINKTCNEEDVCENKNEFKFNLVKENDVFKVDNFGIELNTIESVEE